MNVSLGLSNAFIAQEAACKAVLLMCSQDHTCTELSIFECVHDLIPIISNFITSISQSITVH